jgi:hypothetical protein
MKNKLLFGGTLTLASMVAASLSAADRVYGGGLFHYSFGGHSCPRARAHERR